MGLKYHCPKCGKRYIEWGAEKLGFRCPDCDDEELVRVGVSEEKAAKKPTLKRTVRKATPKPRPVVAENDETEVDLHEVDADQDHDEDDLDEDVEGADEDLDEESGEETEETDEEDEDE